MLLSHLIASVIIFFFYEFASSANHRNIVCPQTIFKKHENFLILNYDFKLPLVAPGVSFVRHSSTATHVITFSSIHYSARARLTFVRIFTFFFY